MTLTDGRVHAVDRTRSLFGQVIVVRRGDRRADRAGRIPGPQRRVRRGDRVRRDLSLVARACFWALLALIAFGIVLIFVQIPGGALIYSVLGLVIFAGLTMVDFQRLRRSTDLDSAPFIAASKFLAVLNVFLFFLQIFDRRRD
jgi:Inhibitor of apoptosis-promoting Bax1